LYTKRSSFDLYIQTNRPSEECLGLRSARWRVKSHKSGFAGKHGLLNDGRELLVELVLLYVSYSVSLQLSSRPISEEDKASARRDKNQCVQQQEPAPFPKPSGKASGGNTCVCGCISTMIKVVAPARKMIPTVRLAENRIALAVREFFNF
jgi:hypothetical protein